MNLALIKKIGIIFVLGFNSGLPITLTASVLKALLHDYSIDLTTLGVFGLITAPYSLKFLWSPLLDSVRLPFLSKLLGQRKSWILLSQMFLISSVVLLGQINPGQNIYLFAAIAFLLAFFSATQDTSIDAYRIKTLNSEEQGVGASSISYGYRTGMVISGIGGLYLAEIFSWEISFMVMGLALVPGAVIGLFAPSEMEGKKTNQSLQQSFVEPFKMFLSTKKWYLILVLVGLYKLSDAYLGAMTMPFIMEAGYSKIEIANAVKSLGLIATLIGTGIGGYLVLKFKPGINLFFAEMLAMISNLPFVLVNILPKNLYLLAVVNGFENFTSVISNIALIAYISNLSKNKYAATYYAILTSITAVGRTILSSSSGWLVVNVGWNNFFVFSAFLSLPSLICIYLLFFYQNN